MAYDSLTTAAVTADLHRRLAGSRIDKIVAPAPLAVGLLFWTGSENQWVLFSAHPVQARVTPTAHRLAGAGAEPPPFVMLLRKYLEGARVTAIEQAGRDRVLTLRAGSSGVSLISEVMGKHSNIILVDAAGIILGSVKRVTAEISRYREVLPHRPYVVPPPPTRTGPPGAPAVPKLDPLGCLPGELCAALSSLAPDGPLWQALVDCLDGCGPQLAREIVARHAGPAAGRTLLTTEATTLEAAAALLAQVRSLYRPADGLWTPSIARRGPKTLGWAVYPLRQYDGQPDVEVAPGGSLEELFDTVYGAGEAGMEAASPLDAARQPLLDALRAQTERTRRKITSLRSGLLDPAALATLREKGQLLLTYAHEIGEGQKTFAPADSPVEIALNPHLTAVENAQAYFARYTKARDATHKVPALIEEAESEQAFLDQARLFVELATSPSDLAQVRTDLRDAGIAADVVGPPRKAPKTPKGVKPQKGAKGKSPAGQAIMRVRAADGTEILVGRSATQNELVTFSLATGSDIWLHARQIPGAHVIIKTAGKPPAPATLGQAAELAATYSQGRSATSVPVDYTPVRLVRRIKGGKPGLVHYSGETTINARPRLEQPV